MNTALSIKGRTSFIYLFIAGLSIMMFSCSQKIHFATSTVVPAAEGTVKVKKDDNNNYSIAVEVQNLAQPNRLPQPKNVYVVWIETEGGSPRNIGQLKTSSGLFSNTLKATLETVTAYKPVRLFITGEDAATVSYPGNYVVLNTSSF